MFYDDSKTLNLLPLHIQESNIDLITELQSIENFCCYSTLNYAS